jgi:HAE1 family hydrophobic/amphiphilic exporter-1
MAAATVTLSIAMASPSFAQPVPLQTAPPPLPPRVGVVGAPPRALSLEEAIRLTLAQNNDVVIARLAVEQAKEDVLVARGFLDPRLQPTFLYQSATSPVTSIIGGAANGSVKQTQWNGGAAAVGRSPWAGGRISVDFSATRLETNNNLQRLNPQFPAAAGITFVQPLFRNRSLDRERYQVLLNRAAVDISDAQLAGLLMDQLSLVEQAYWDLTFASRNVEVQSTALGQARRQVESNERQVQQGTLAPIDVVEAEIQVATFEQSVATAQQVLTEAENRLKTLMLTDRHSDLWNRALLPAEVLDQDAPELTLEGAVALAMSRRPELDEFGGTLAQNVIDRRFFTDQARPQVDVVARYGLAGLAGTIVDQSGGTIGGGTIPSFFAGGLGTALGTIVDRRFPTMSVGLQIDLPLGNRTARANLAKATIASTQLTRTRNQLEQAIEAEVRNGLQAVTSSQARLRAAASAARNAQQQYESEQRRFESGLGTVFLVLQRQTALVTSQAQEVRARTDLNQAIAALNRAIGVTLERHGVSLQSLPSPS